MGMMALTVEEWGTGRRQVHNELWKFTCIEICSADMTKSLAESQQRVIQRLYLLYANKPIRSRCHERLPVQAGLVDRLPDVEDRFRILLVPHKSPQRGVSVAESVLAHHFQAMIRM